MNDNNKINMPAQTTKSALPNDDEYINTYDGLIYCKRCNTPRQKRVSALGKTYMRDIMCQCQREAYEKEEAERIRREFLNDIAVKRSAGLHDRALYECTFDKDMGYNSRQSEKAYEYTLHFPEMLEKGIGLLLWGRYWYRQNISSWVHSERPFRPVYTCYDDNVWADIKHSYGYVSGRQKRLYRQP